MKHLLAQGFGGGGESWYKGRFSLILTVSLHFFMGISKKTLFLVLTFFLEESPEFSMKFHEFARNRKYIGWTVSVKENFFSKKACIFLENRLQ